MVHDAEQHLYDMVEYVPTWKTDLSGEIKSIQGKQGEQIDKAKADKLADFIHTKGVEHILTGYFGSDWDQLKSKFKNIVKQHAHAWLPSREDITDTFKDKAVDLETIDGWIDSITETLRRQMRGAAIAPFQYAPVGESVKALEGMGAKFGSKVDYGAKVRTHKDAVTHANEVAGLLEGRYRYHKRYGVEK